MPPYFIKTPWLVKVLFSNYTWHMPVQNNEVYLTFDDGPHPQITPWVLDELKKYNAQATFFCIGQNVVQHPHIYERILAEGHAVGNHTQNHLNGWNVSIKEYIADVATAAACINSSLFRPPYGRIKKAQAKQLTAALQSKNVKIIMWDVLSADFDRTVTPQQCLKNVIHNYTAGSIIVFHDSEKASANLFYTLPKVLQHLQENNRLLKKIEVFNQAERL